MCFWNIFLYFEKYLLIHLHSIDWMISLSPVIWDGNWVKRVSCVLHSCKHAPHRRDPCRKISLLHTPGTFGLLIWLSVHMTEDRSSLQRCVAHKQNHDGVCSLNYSHGARDLMLLIFFGGTSVKKKETIV